MHIKKVLLQVTKSNNFNNIIWIYKLMQKQAAIQKPSLQQLKKQAEKKNDIPSFIRSYQLKQKAVKQLVIIYSKNIFSQQFASTFKAAIALIVLPSLTNLYYSIRSHTLLAGIMPFAVPIICFTNYIYFFNKEMQEFSLTNHIDAQIARNQYEIIYQFSYFSRDLQGYMSKLQNYRLNEKRIDEVI